MRSTRSGIRGTPVRMRPDIGADRRARVVSLDDNVRSIQYSIMFF